MTTLPRQAGGVADIARLYRVYLGDPRRSAPERLRTIIRQAVEPDAPVVRGR